MEPPSLGQAAARLHEQRRDMPAKFGREALDIAAQHRRKVGIDQRRIAARHQLDRWRKAVADRDLGEPGGAGQRLQPRLMRREAPAVDQDDGDRAQTCGNCSGEGRGCCLLVQRQQHFPFGADPFCDLDHLGIERLGQNDVAGEQLGAFLAADSEGIAKALGDRQHTRLALAFEQGVGGNRGAHPYLGVGQRSRRHPGQLADRRDCRIFAAQGVFGQQLGGQHLPIGRAGDNVGEGPAAVDPELPARRVQCPPRLSWRRPGSPQSPRGGSPADPRACRC